MNFFLKQLRLFRLAHCFVYLLHSQKREREKKKKKNSPLFFFLFTATNRHMVSFRGRVPELNPPSSLCHLFGVFLPVFLWPIILI